jgi:hypothetical protein
MKKVRLITLVLLNKNTKHFANVAHAMHKLTASQHMARP